MMEVMFNGELDKDKFMERLDGFSTLDIDRELFAFPKGLSAPISIRWLCLFGHCRSLVNLQFGSLTWISNIFYETMGVRGAIYAL